MPEHWSVVDVVPGRKSCSRQPSQSPRCVASPTHESPEGSQQRLIHYAWIVGWDNLNSIGEVYLAEAL